MSEIVTLLAALPGMIIAVPTIERYCRRAARAFGDGAAISQGERVLRLVLVVI